MVETQNISGARVEFRDGLVACLRREAFGPDPWCAEQDEDVLAESPRQRYIAGVLFPTNEPIVELDDVSETESATDADGTEAVENPEETAPAKDRRKTGGSEFSADSFLDDSVRMANSRFPSAMGLTFVCDRRDGGVVIECRASEYESFTDASAKSKFDERKWRRKPLDLQPVTVNFDPDRDRGQVRSGLAEHVELRVLYRRRVDGRYFVTVSIVNTRAASGEIPSAAECLYQTAFRVRDSRDEPVFHEYRRAKLRTDPEEQSLELLYRHRLAFAVGHGCAATWGAVTGGTTDEVATSAIPDLTIPPVEPRTDGGDELSMYFLGGGDGSAQPDRIPPALQALTESYEGWIKDQQRDGLPDVPQLLKKRGEAHLKDCDRCLKRMESGIELLRKDPLALKAFMLANRAILMQQYHSRRPRREPDGEWKPLPASYQPDAPDSGRWRCFQIGFILMNLPSFSFLENGQPHPDRDLVDLIWFPTGGGKTEAYLGLAAYVIFLRRLQTPDNDGTVALMRYTLRLLTSQQLQRASSLICACELIRQEMPDELGKARITIGLWGGESLSPNLRADAIVTVNALAREDYGVENRFQLLTCPWCGTALDRPSDLGYVVRGTPKTVHLTCPEAQCPFSIANRGRLPVLVIDEDVYDEPPTLVIGTVDKFAMLAWRGDAGGLFGLTAIRRCDPPELIIQDELHLISGPLGSMVGLYETVIHMLCSWNGLRPKVVASTATIRRAADQCRKLYNQNVAQFPPHGLSVSDSFFAKENKASPGRKYVGVLASAASSFVTAQVRVSSALLQGCRSLPLPDGADEQIRDPYWTLLQYFNSLRELGHAATLVQADIREYMWTIAVRDGIPKELCRTPPEPVELTSRLNAQEIPEVLERLRYSYPPSEQDPWKNRPIDVLLATNMISVGVDIDRLGLMEIVGQPKTTSEYIQASSRVGRIDKCPGLVISMYDPGKPRDRSHYEHFRGYHSAFYRYVEPTSVTPFSIPALERALHALLVIAARHLASLSEPDQFDKDDARLMPFYDELMARCAAIDPSHQQFLHDLLEKYKTDWGAVAPGIWGKFGQRPEERPLMYPAGTEPKDDWNDLAWSTPSSMRCVDIECEAEVIGKYVGSDEVAE